jgi:signal transduction histidine kinase
MSFRLKTSCWIIVLQLGIFLALIWSGLQALRLSNEQEITTRATTTAALFASMAKEAVLTTDLATLEHFVAEVLANPGVVYARVLDRERLLVQGGDPQSLARSFAVDTRLARVTDGVFDIAVPILEAGTTFGRVELGLSTTHMQGAFERTRRTVIGIAALGILVMTLGSFGFVTYLTRQMTFLQQASQRIARGDFDHNIPVRGHDELAQTAMAFNHMMQHLQRLYDELYAALQQAGAQATELRQAKETAEAATRAKSAFLATMSHELRTPLNGVIGVVDLLCAMEPAPEQQEYIEIIRRSGEHLLAIIDDILDFSYADTGKIILESSAFAVLTAVEEVLAGYVETAACKGLKLACCLDAAVPSLVVGDPGRLRQVLSKLVDNAVKFTDTGEVVVRVAVAATTDCDLLLRLAVTDTGIGIAPEIQARLFEAFSQADSSMTRKYGGTGIGLALAKKLVELMGGTIGVESTPGQSSTFWFTVPLTCSQVPQGRDSVAA